MQPEEGDTVGQGISKESKQSPHCNLFEVEETILPDSFDVSLLMCCYL